MNLILVLSFGGSLRRWHEQGILSREIEVYVAYLKYGIVSTLHIFSYNKGDQDFVKFIDADEDIKSRIVLHTPARPLGNWTSKLLYSINPAMIFRFRGRDIDVAKTNQISGSWVCFFLRAAGTRIFARCGYLLSRRRYKDGHPGRAAIAWVLELLLFNMADIVSVTTASAAQTVRRRVAGKDKVFFNPTYVNTSIFSGDAGKKSCTDAVLYVGRFEPGKNIPNLVTACARSGFGVHIIGEGRMRPQIEAAAAQSGARVEFLGTMQNNAVAERFRSYRYYAMISLHEGLPKSLIEAMSCEMICIGTDVPGISDLIVDGKTGYLAAGTDAAAISEAISRARAAPDSADVARAARQFILEHHSLPNYVERELGYFRKFLKARGIDLPSRVTGSPGLAQ
jgi:glycosyltransferase involved in cell wall biosynthesis